jgi:hypothetical protein
MSSRIRILFQKKNTKLDYGTKKSLNRMLTSASVKFDGTAGDTNFVEEIRRRSTTAERESDLGLSTRRALASIYASITIRRY